MNIGKKVKDILAVDDFKSNTRFYSIILTKEGYNVRTAENVEEAKSKIIEKQPDLVITDFEMPDENGDALIKYLRKNHPNTGIILITTVGSNTSTGELLFHDSKARDAVEKYNVPVLGKPLEPKDLIAIVKKAFEVNNNYNK